MFVERSEANTTDMTEVEKYKALVEAMSPDERARELRKYVES
jgi:hypothetical protein